MKKFLTKKKKKYENEWNRLTAVADVESVMERASHFEDIDPDKFARLKSKHPNSPPPPAENLTNEDNYLHDTNTNNIIFYDTQPHTQLKVIKSLPTTFEPTSSFSIPRGKHMRIIVNIYIFFCL